MGWMNGGMGLVTALVRLYLRVHTNEERKRRELERLARKPGRVHPHLPYNSAYHQATPTAKKG